MGVVWIVFEKELKNALRDRRTLFSTFIFPLVILPLLVLLPALLTGHKIERIKVTKSKIGIIEDEEFYELNQALKESGKFIILKIENPEEALRKEEVDCVIEIVKSPKGMGSGEVLIYSNSTRDESEGAADKVRLILSQLSNRILHQRLERLNLSPEVFTPLRIESRDIATPRERSGFFMGSMVGMFVLIGLLSGGMVLALDATAGEKERRTLEVLLASPAKRRDLVLGKFLGAVVMGIISTILMSVGFISAFFFGLPMISKEAASEIGFAIPCAGIPYLALILLLTACFIGALEISLGVFARSFREGQSYFSPFMIIAIIPMVFMPLIPPHPSAKLFYIPLFNVMLILREILMGIVNTEHIFNTIFSSLFCTLFALRLAFSMFKREKAILRY